jgi:Na+/H+ antiporter NhaA
VRPDGGLDDGGTDETGGAVRAGEKGRSRASTLAGTTAWTQRVQTPLKEFLRTETGSAIVLLLATVVALVWVNVDAPSYRAVWSTRLSVLVGGKGVSLELRDWVNSGLMTFFFFVVGLELRREFDLGDLRERRRLVLPLVAGLAGAAVAVGLYLVFTAGRPAARGWGVAMSTDTAFALGLLTLVGPRFSDRLRAFLLTAVLVDDIVALVLIAVVYSGSLAVVPLVVALVFYGAVLVARRLRVSAGPAYFVLGACAWVALQRSGIEPVVIGMAMGTLAYAHPAERSELESATRRFREFREQPTAELAQVAAAQLRAATSRNERLQQLWHPWTSYVIVPLFALANAGIVIRGPFLARAVASPITLGILVGFTVGKPVGILAGTWLVSRLSHHRIKPPVGWAAVAGGGTIAGIGFTLSLLIATIAFEGAQLEEAKLGILAAAAVASILTWSVFRVTDRLPRRQRLRALLGTARSPTDLYPEVDLERDHVRGPPDAPVTLVEYGDFECPHCGQAEPAVRELLRESGDVRYVWRHLPLNDVHPRAQLAAEASEAAGAQGLFWEMHDVMLDRQHALEPKDVLRYAQELGIDLERFTKHLRGRAGAARVADDVESADLSSVSGTPTFFVNGRRHYGAFDLATLSAAVRAASAEEDLARS